MTKFVRLFYYLQLITFWGWNIAFLAIIILGILPSVRMEIVSEMMQGLIPVNFLVSFLLLVIIPSLSLLLALKYLMKQPHLQLRLFYGVEAPLFLLSLIRLFLIRELNTAMVFIIGSILASTFIYLVHILSIAKNIKSDSHVSLALKSILMILSLYCGVLILLYSVVVGGKLFFNFITFEWFADLVEFLSRIRITSLDFLSLFLIPISLLYFIFSSTLFILLPYCLVFYYFEAWFQTFKLNTLKSTIRVPLLITAIVTLTWITGFKFVSDQKQVETLSKLSAPIVNESQKRNIINNSEKIREDLLSVYLYPYRYLALKKDVDIIHKLYKNTFAILPDAITFKLQKLHNFILSPILYNGNADDDVKAANLYSAIFDMPIQKAEGVKIVQAIQSTFNRQEVKAGLLNINEQKVLLTKQEIKYEQHADSTDVEIYEEYQNKTFDRQEIYYYFTLPESAVITGLWLGTTPDREKRDKFIVSPRGAAKRVYESQVRINVDPALLEQVGPLQYRLRAFPIPAMRFIDNSLDLTKTPQEKMHLWLNYTLVNSNENIIFPVLLEKRNIFWDHETVRVVNGTTEKGITNWMPHLINVKNNNDLLKPRKLLSGIKTFDIFEKSSSESFANNKKNKIAILIDSSYSMSKNKELISSNIKLLSEVTSVESIDYYVHPVGEGLTKINISAELDKILFFGFQSEIDLWNQVSLIQHDRDYDSIFVLSDRGSYELIKDKPIIDQSKIPVWYVHLDQLAPAYDDQLIFRLQNCNGGVSNNLKDAYLNFVTRQDLTNKQVSIGSVIYDIEESTNQEATKDINVDPFAAKIVINYLTRNNKEPSIELLDSLHLIAKNNSIITPYSSMIVLVNESQKEQLKKEEENENRFERGVDSGIENLDKPFNPLVSAVPEPETWALILITFCMLCFIYYKRNDVKVA